METKIKTQTNDERKPNPSGEVQVRELSDVLGSAEEEAAAEIKKYSEKLIQAKLKEFQMKYMAKKIDYIFENKKTTEKLYDLIQGVGYKQYTARPELNMHTRLRADQKIDIILMYDLSEIKLENVKPGICYAHLDDISELKSLETEINSFKHPHVRVPEYGPAIGMIGTLGALIGALIGGIAGDSFSGAVIGGMIGLVPGCTSGYLIEKTMLENETKAKQTREEKITKYFSEFSKGKDAILKGIYGK